MSINTHKCICLLVAAFSWSSSSSSSSLPDPDIVQCWNLSKGSTLEQAQASAFTKLRPAFRLNDKSLYRSVLWTTIALRKWILIACSSQQSLQCFCPTEWRVPAPFLVSPHGNVRQLQYSTPHSSFLSCCRYRRGLLSRSSEGMQVVRARMTVWWLLIFLALVQFPEPTKGQSKYLFLIFSLLSSMCRFTWGISFSHHSSCGLLFLWPSTSVSSTLCVMDCRWPFLTYTLIEIWFKRIYKVVISVV